MKHARLAICILVLLTGFMLSQSGAAEAHGLEKHAVSAALPVGPSDMTQKALLKQAAQKWEIAAVSSQEDGKCDGKCCMNSACCSPMAIPLFEIPAYDKVVTFVFAIPLQSPPQGPPYMLLRPPKFSA